MNFDKLSSEIGKSQKDCLSKFVSISINIWFVESNTQYFLPSFTWLQLLSSMKRVVFNLKGVRFFFFVQIKSTSFYQYRAWHPIWVVVSFIKQSAQSVFHLKEKQESVAANFLHTKRLLCKSENEFSTLMNLTNQFDC